MWNEVLSWLWLIIQILTGYNLFLPLVLYGLYRLLPGRTLLPVNPEGDYGIIVTAYEQTEPLPAVVSSLLKLRYANYHIYVVADKCDISDLRFDNERVSLLKPEQVLAGNTRSHFYAIRHFIRPHNRLVIIDSDNLVHPDYLTQTDIFFNQGYRAVQGIREAKNLDTTYACLDAARDIYYHFYDGRVLFKLGSSATLAGSGMAFDTGLYKECLEYKEISGAGFDKVLQYEIVKRGYRIAFAPEAIVYDEKTSQTDQLVNQRSRWINTWFRYFGYGFNLLIQGICTFSFNRFLFGLILLRPPLFIFLFLSAFCMLINLWADPLVSLIWLAGFLCFIISFVIALSASHTDKRIYRSLISIPRFMFYQIISLIHARMANKRSVATRHSYTAKDSQT